MPFQQSAFDGTTLAILQRAYDEACEEAGLTIESSRAPWISEARARLAAMIMDLASAGELDPKVLKQRALAAPLTGK